ncbi:MAG: arylsulfatase [Planctomycetota bacterium]|jgi:arylsulfatase
MKRRNFLKALGLGMAGIAISPGRALADNKATNRPNIILIMADDMGFSDLGCYGSEIQTPNLDRLSEGGLRFTHFYNNAKCAPSRASLMTGLYPQQVQGDKMRNSVNIAQVLKTVGYRTLMTGRGGGLAGLPCEHGFDRFYGLASACCNYFNPGLKRPGENEPGRKYPNEQRPWAIDDKIIQPYTPKDKDFYSTDAFTDCAIEYLNQYGKDNKPFFLYIPYTAPHFPLHARPQDITKYRGKYKIGWDAIRQQRYERQIELGLIDKQWKLSTRDTNVQKWDDVEDKDSSDLDMAVYAAMIDRMDQGIGRIMAKVRQLGIEDNTLVLFLSDNGSCAEDYKAFNSTAPEIPPGPMESYRTLGVSWANASNTPFRKYKWWDYEGGMSTPLIAYWPGVIKDGGKITHQVCHIMDIMATCLDITGAQYPSNYNGQMVQPLKGKSLLPIFQGKRRRGHEVLYWQFGSSLAIRKGKWKLVCAHANPRAGIDYFSESNDNPKRKPNGDKHWELYDMHSDRTETNDLAEKYPELVKQMAQEWDQWKKRVEIN